MISLSPDEFRKHPEISVLRESLRLFQSGAAGCRSSNSAELAEAAILSSGAQSPAPPGTAQHQLSSEPCPTSLCPHRAPSCAGSVGIITTYCLKRAELFFFSTLYKRLSFSSTLPTLLFVSQLAELGHSPDFCPDGG